MAKVGRIIGATILAVVVALQVKKLVCKTSPKALPYVEKKPEESNRVSCGCRWGDFRLVFL